MRQGNRTSLIVLLLIDAAVAWLFSYLHETRDPNEFVLYILLSSPVLVLLIYMTIHAAKNWPPTAGWK